MKKLSCLAWGETKLFNGEIKDSNVCEEQLPSGWCELSLEHDDSSKSWTCL